MDTYRGSLADQGGYQPDYSDSGDDEIAREAPPLAIGQDERRMQVRAYNHWASLLDGHSYPSVHSLDPAHLPDFGPFSVLLDFTNGIENPAIPFLGARLAEECTGGETHGAPIRELNDVPARSLLSRITDHYMQILANQAPIGFEAEFVNQAGRTVLYRGILLPFSSADDKIDFIYGVINWKELADQQTTDELMLQIDQVLDAPAAPSAKMPVALPSALPEAEPLAEWADGPAEDPAGALADDDDILELISPLDSSTGEVAWPEPMFGEGEGDAASTAGDVPGAYADFDLAAALPEVFAPDDAGDMGADDPSTKDPAGEDPAGEDIVAEDMELADWLASARELAQAAQGSEDRTRHALYAAIGRAYDFSLAAAAAPEDFSELVADSGLTVQDRAPMTPVVKLVFGADYDKTRLTEYASALNHAHRIALPRGELTGYLRRAPGGLKGIVTEERRLRREESGKTGDLRESPAEALAHKLRALDYAPLETVAEEGSEFTLLVARRLPSGEVVLLGEVADDLALLERAARKLGG